MSPEHNFVFLIWFLLHIVENQWASYEALFRKGRGWPMVSIPYILYKICRAFKKNMGVFLYFSWYYLWTLSLKNICSQKYGYGGWVHMNHATSSCSGPREADMMKDGKFFRKVKVKAVFILFKLKWWSVNESLVQSLTAHGRDYYPLTSSFRLLSVSRI
jgi:hypothetical protein